MSKKYVILLNICFTIILIKSSFHAIFTNNLVIIDNFTHFINGIILSIPGYLFTSNVHNKYTLYPTSYLFLFIYRKLIGMPLTSLLFSKLIYFTCICIEFIILFSLIKMLNFPKYANILSLFLLSFNFYSNVWRPFLYSEILFYAILLVVSKLLSNKLRFASAYIVVSTLLIFSLISASPVFWILILFSLISLFILCNLILHHRRHLSKVNFVKLRRNITFIILLLVILVVSYNLFIAALFTKTALITIYTRSISVYAWGKVTYRVNVSNLISDRLFNDIKILFKYYYYVYEILLLYLIIFSFHNLYLSGRKSCWSSALLIVSNFIIGLAISVMFVFFVFPAYLGRFLCELIILSSLLCGSTIYSLLINKGKRDGRQILRRLSVVIPLLILVFLSWVPYKYVEYTYLFSQRDIASSNFLSKYICNFNGIIGDYRHISLSAYLSIATKLNEIAACIDRDCLDIYLKISAIVIPPTIKYLQERIFPENTNIVILSKKSHYYFSLWKLSTIENFNNIMIYLKNDHSMIYFNKAVYILVL